MISRRSLLQVLASVPLLSVFRPKPPPDEFLSAEVPGEAYMVAFGWTVAASGEDFGVWRVKDDVTLVRVRQGDDVWPPHPICMWTRLEDK